MTFRLRYLTEDDCAKCRECCVFDRYDVYDTPLITEEDAQRIRLIYSDIRFTPRPCGDCGQDAYIFDMICDGDVRICPALGSNGCILDGCRPLDCVLYPYMIVGIGQRRYAAVSDLCPVYRKLPDDLLYAEVCDNMELFALTARRNIYVREHDGQRLIKEIL
ncbi:MAG: hypothetical protein IKR73_04460 [Oscillospiraceae bacterium]|nr:hypothetical protein [Oscillospiraceae bacterium]